MKGTRKKNLQPTKKTGNKTHVYATIPESDLTLEPKEGGNRGRSQSKGRANYLNLKISSKLMATPNFTRLNSLHQRNYSVNCPKPRATPNETLLVGTPEGLHDP
jgi:hypothetical protein